MWKWKYVREYVVVKICTVRDELLFDRLQPTNWRLVHILVLLHVYNLDYNKTSIMVNVY